MKKDIFNSLVQPSVWGLSIVCCTLCCLNLAVAEDDFEQAPTEQATGDNKTTEQLDKLVVSGVRERLYRAGMLKDVIQKTELITDEGIAKTNSVTLTEAIAKSPGVRVNTECSMCGAKRVMLNGLRGEHTTVLVDGVPLYTMLSGFYGLDAAATAGLQSIEIARGAGASLTAPEAIGGTLNMITKTAYDDGLEIDISGGENGYQKASLVGTMVANEDSTRMTVIGQFDNRDEFDGDDNGVSENPSLKNKVMTFKLSQDIGQWDNLDLRASLISSEVFGGPTKTNIDQVREDFRNNPDPSNQMFVDGDVRNRFIGHSWETAEWVQSDRQELSANWLHDFSNWNLNVILADVTHEQDSFYEGFDYDTKNTMNYADIHANIYAYNNHHITVGINRRDEKNRSVTSADQDPNYISDSFNYDSKGLYLQDTWTVTDRLEIAAAVRFDEVEADFIDPQKAGVEIAEKLISPRIDTRYLHSENWISRLSVGRGYRAPLSFFESDHGLLDSGLGFDIQVDRLEKSMSYNYSLSYEAERLNFTTALAHTSIRNLAILAETTVGGSNIPSLQQSAQTAKSLLFDISASYQLTDHLSIGTTYEMVNYDDNFKQAFAIVPIKSRLNLTADWEIGSWDMFFSVTHIGKRKLSEYGTEDGATFDQAGNLPKSRTAKAFWLADVKFTTALTEQLTLYFGANNLFNYSQAKNMESPLMYVDGGYDVIDIYGPLRGREAYAGLKWSF